MALRLAAPGLQDPQAERGYLPDCISGWKGVFGSFTRTVEPSARLDVGFVLLALGARPETSLLSDLMAGLFR